MKNLLLYLLLFISFTAVQAQEVKNANGRTNFPELKFVAPEPAIMIATYDANNTPNIMMATWGGQSNSHKAITGSIAS